MARIYLGQLGPPPPAAPTGTKLLPTSPDVAPTGRPTRRGRMEVLLTLHGGQNALSEVMGGLVERNAAAIRKGTVPPLSQITPNQLTLVRMPHWLDAPTALNEKRVTRGTLAAWEAADMAVRGANVSVGYIGDVPVVVDSQTRQQISDPSLRFGRDPHDRHLPTGGREDPDEGRVQETMFLTIDDDEGSPVRIIGNAIARHNARRIKKHNLPNPYEAAVRYRTEGSPERWWDAEEILLAGYDDCEGLAAYVAGWHIAQGRDAEVWTRVMKIPSVELGGSGRGRLFHAVTRVRGPDGSWYVDDPSARLGMPVPGWYTDLAAKRRAQGHDI